MKRSPRSQRWTASEAQRVLDDLKRSGLSTPRFAQQRGLSVERLYKWQHRLGTKPHASKAFTEVNLALPSSAAIELTIGDLTARFSGSARLEDALAFAQRLHQS